MPLVHWWIKDTSEIEKLWLVAIIWLAKAEGLLSMSAPLNLFIWEESSRICPR